MSSTIPPCNRNQKKIDLFVYSDFSNLGSLVTPLQIYHHAQKKGLDFITITDLNTIYGCLEVLNRYPNAPDFIIGETVTVLVPEFKTSITLGVYGITEESHIEIQKLRHNLDDLIPFLKEKKITYVLNHFLYTIAKHSLSPDLIAKLLRSFDIFEVHHGKNIQEQNTMLAYFIKTLTGKGICGGSHALSLTNIGKVYTVCEAQNKYDLLQAIRTGQVSTEGTHISIKNSFQEFFENYQAKIKYDLYRKKIFSGSWKLIKFPLSSFQKILKVSKEISDRTNDTSYYSHILGAALTSPCYIPKEWIEE